MRPLVAIVDDHQDTRMMLEALLGDQYLVTSYPSAREAFAEMKQRRPDVLVTDMLLEDGVGTELVRWMLADPILRSVPAIVLTGLPLDQGLAAAGFRRLLQKPVEHDELLAVIAELLKECESKNAAAA